MSRGSTVPVSLNLCIFNQGVDLLDIIFTQFHILHVLLDSLLSRGTGNGKDDWQPVLATLRLDPCQAHLTGLAPLARSERLEFFD